MATILYRDRHYQWGGAATARPWNWSGHTGGMIIMLAMLMGGLLVAQAPHSGSSMPRPGPGGPAAVAKGAPPPACQQGDPPAYVATLRQKVAQGFHLTVAQLQAQVRSRKSLLKVAAARHLSARQLHMIEVRALTAATDLLVRMGCTTRTLATATVRYYVGKGPADMNDRFTWWLTR